MSLSAVSDQLDHEGRARRRRDQEERDRARRLKRDEPDREVRQRRDEDEVRDDGTRDFARIAERTEDPTEGVSEPHREHARHREDDDREVEQGWEERIHRVPST